MTAIAVVLLAVTASVAVPVAASAKPAASHVDPRRVEGLYVDPTMPAAMHGTPYAKIGREAQALWITDFYSITDVRSAVHNYVTRAAREKKTPILAIYAIPDRDCGQASAGGEPSADAYKRWLGQVAQGLHGAHALVVIEPDAVAELGDCSGQGNRAGLLRWASQVLSKTDAWVYLDAGHSGWHSAAVMATRLKESGVAYVRGISVNVGNYLPTNKEQAYAESVLAALKSKGIANKYFVIDTSRNGVAPRNSQVCNPVWARIGTPPRLILRGEDDGLLWIKHPGESDGPCNGGPSSGVWSNTLANRLLGRG